MGRARDISKVFSTGTSLSTDSEVSGSYLTLASASTTYQTKASAGLTLLTPPSITATGGSGSIGANGSVAFTSASAISLNSIFSSSYTNYRILINQSSASTVSTMRFRMRSGSTDDSGANYALAGIYTRSDNATIASWRDPYTSLSSWYLGEYHSSTPTPYSLDIFNPNVASKTGISLIAAGYNDTSHTIFNFTHQGLHVPATAYDGFTIYAASGTITGTVTVYGYNK